MGSFNISSTDKHTSLHYFVLFILCIVVRCCTKKCWYRTIIKIKNIIYFIIVYIWQLKISPWVSNSNNDNSQFIIMFHPSHYVQFKTVHCLMWKATSGGLSFQVWCKLLLVHLHYLLKYRHIVNHIHTDSLSWHMHHQDIFSCNCSASGTLVMCYNKSWTSEVMYF